MPLDEYPIVFNTSVRFKQSLSLTETQVMEFFGEVVKAIPELSEYEQAKDGESSDSVRKKGPTHTLVQRGQGRHVRQLVLQAEDITLAVAPPLGVTEADRTARIVYPLISRFLRPNPLFLDFLDISFRFEFPYRGNHNQLVLTKLFANTPFAELAEGIRGAVRNFEPGLNLSISSDHSTIAIVQIRTATTPREIESKVYDGDDIMLLCGIAKTRGLGARSVEETYEMVYADALPFVEGKLVPSVVKILEKAVHSEEPS